MKLPKGLDILSYDYYAVAFSGGKDSMASFLHLLDLGVPIEKIELHHHLVDGRESAPLFDYNVTEDQCRKFAEAFGVPIYFSWRVGGIEGEMTKNNSKTKPVRFENPDGSISEIGGTRGKIMTRMMYPMIAMDLKYRWCSAYAKIDVMKAVLNNSSRFVGKRVLVVTGERLEEATKKQQEKKTGRAGYKVFEKHSTYRMSKRVSRHIDHFRPVHKFSTKQVWEIIERYNVIPHPAYYLGFGRLSCQFCIFGNKNQFKTAQQISPAKFERLAKYEVEFELFHGKPQTMIQGKTLPDHIATGKVYDGYNWDLAKVCNNEIYEIPIFCKEGEWIEPSGAYASLSGGSQ